MYYKHTLPTAVFQNNIVNLNLPNFRKLDAILHLSFIQYHGYKTPFLSKTKEFDLRVLYPKLDLAGATVTLSGSHDGLLWFNIDRCCNSGVYYDVLLLNPVTHDNVIVIGDEICDRRYYLTGILQFAVYFHLSSLEYRILAIRRNEKRVWFTILSLRTKSTRLLETNFAYPPYMKTNPVILHGALHWMASKRYEDNEAVPPPSCSKSIILFNIESEEFNAIRHPGVQCTHRMTKDHCLNMQLSEMEGCLCLCNVTWSERLIEVWVLEDYENQGWVKAWVIDFSPILSHFKYNTSEKESHSMITVTYFPSCYLLLRKKWMEIHMGFGSPKVEFYYNLRLGRFDWHPMEEVKARTVHAPTFFCHTDKFFSFYN
ncbi:hypothetical protein GIB67_006977 [Kingdonia uniflora]|uniref:F-box associated beta-propeller type 3 domain-containing protein n=1 Tax=Kingdonia uniflora TaxID=39325 RepID=A0A7J7NZV3_9MAGN|nr:hypothetical protein GIB67_006977 [Kingdonia uniflora]